MINSNDMSFLPGLIHVPDFPEFLIGNKAGIRHFGEEANGSVNLSLSHVGTSQAVLDFFKAEFAITVLVTTQEGLSLLGRVINSWSWLWFRLSSISLSGVCSILVGIFGGAGHARFVELLGQEVQILSCFSITTMLPVERLDELSIEGVTFIAVFVGITEFASDPRIRVLGIIMIFVLEDHLTTFVMTSAVGSIGRISMVMRVSVMVTLVSSLPSLVHAIDLGETSVGNIAIRSPRDSIEVSHNLSYLEFMHT